jgi:hypothetical protein
MARELRSRAGEGKVRARSRGRRTTLDGTRQGRGGMAAPGTYTFYGANVQLDVRGLDASGNVVNGTARLATTCQTDNASCAFTRTVTAATTVPEPGTVALVATGLLGLMAAVRRRQAV